MRKLLLLAGALLMVSLPAVAQESPRAEVFFGYAYQRSQIAGPVGKNTNGWNGSVAGNLNDWFGVKADISGHYGSVSGVKFNVYHFLFGPQFTYRKAERPTPFAHVLFGTSRAGNGTSDTAFSWAVGGGLDVKVNKSVSIRVFQGDYIQTRFGNDTQNHARISFGITLKLGGK